MDSPAAQQRTPRALAVILLLVCTLWSAVAEAIIFNLNNSAVTRIAIRVGGGGNNISEVSFTVPAAQLGDGTSITGTPGIRFRIQIRASGASRSNPVDWGDTSSFALANSFEKKLPI